METTKSKLEEFLKNNPSYKSFFCDYMEQQKTKINKKVGTDKKEEIIEKFEKLYNVAGFKKFFLPEFKFKLELLKKENSDFKLLEESLSLNEIYDWKTINTVNIYRVISNDNTSTESKTSNSSQILLLHGTKAPNVEGILKTGFKPSEKGFYGPGVYLTDSVNIAYDYGMYVAQEEGIFKCFRYLFVNQLSQYDVKVSTNEFKEPIPYKDYLIQDPSVQLYRGYTRKSVTFVDSENDKFYGKDKKISRETLVNDYGNCIIGVAHHDLVTPVYLIEIEEKLSLEEIVQEITYEYFDVFQYVEEDELSTNFQNMCIDDNNSNEVQEYTLETITKEIEKKIDMNRQAKIKYLMSKLDDEIDSIIDSIMEQLPFNLSSIIEATIDDVNRKYKPELLQKEDDDYKFVVRSIKNKNAENYPEIVHIFKINPVNKNEVCKMENKYLYLNGIKSNEVNNILTFGYPEKQNNSSDDSCEDLDYYHYAYTFLEHEIEDGISYDEVDNVVKKLSFVFMVSSEEKYEDYCTKNKEIIKDSRGSCAEVGLFSDETCESKTPIPGLIPAYLIVFELE